MTRHSYIYLPLPREFQGFVNAGPLMTESLSLIRCVSVLPDRTRKKTP
jgi:hypothetical protein